MLKRNPERHNAFFLTNNARCPAKVKSVGRKVMLGSRVAGNGRFIWFFLTLFMFLGLLAFELLGIVGLIGLLL
jgi:hypothetical protein